jgi:hypothetical protein
LLPALLSPPLFPLYIHCWLYPSLFSYWPPYHIHFFRKLHTYIIYVHKISFFRMLGLIV